MGVMRQCSQGIGELFYRLIYSVIEVVWLVICYVYIPWWNISSFARRVLTESAIIVILVASGLVFLEIASDVFSKHIELIHLPRWAEALVLLLAFWLVYHRYKEFRQLRKESVFAATVARLFEEIAQLQFVPGEAGNYQALQNFVHKVLVAFLNVYQSKRQPQMNVMLKHGDGRLRIYFIEPVTAKYEDGISFAAGEGGAGTAFSEGITVYFPAIRYRHGISVVVDETDEAKYQEKYELLETVYRRCEAENFASVICTPVRCGGTTFGVLNVDSKGQNAFDMTDIHAAQVAASAVGMAIDRYRTSS